MRSGSNIPKYELTANNLSCGVGRVNLCRTIEYRTHDQTRWRTVPKIGRDMRRTRTGGRSMTGAGKRLTYRERNKRGRSTRTMPYMVLGHYKISRRGWWRSFELAPLYSVNSNPSNPSGEWRSTRSRTRTHDAITRLTGDAVTSRWKDRFRQVATIVSFEQLLMAPPPALHSFLPFSTTP